MKHLPAILATLLAALAVYGCSSTPRGVIGKEKMARILADLNIAEGIVESDRRSYPTDSTKVLLRQSIYARHGVTTEQVDSSFKWYGYHMDKYIEVYDLAIELVENDIQTTTANAGTNRENTVNRSIYATEGDSVDVWGGQKLRIFAANMPTDIATFHIVSDRNWEKGDIYTLKARLTGSISPLTLSITAEYPDGTRDYVSSQSSGTGWHHLDLPLNPEKKASTVYGFISASPQGRDIMIADSIALVRRRAGSSSAPRSTVKELSSLYGR